MQQIPTALQVVSGWKDFWALSVILGREPSISAFPFVRIRLPNYHHSSCLVNSAKRLGSATYHIGSYALQEPRVAKRSASHRTPSSVLIRFGK